MEESAYPTKSGYYWYEDDRTKHKILVKVVINEFKGFDVEFFDSDYDTESYYTLSEEELDKLYPIFQGPIEDLTQVIEGIKTHEANEIATMCDEILCDPKYLGLSRSEFSSKVLKKFKLAVAITLISGHGYIRGLLSRGAIDENFNDKNEARKGN
jgi:hypothetical protein